MLSTIIRLSRYAFTLLYLYFQTVYCKDFENIILNLYNTHTTMSYYTVIELTHKNDSRKILLLHVYVLPHLSIDIRTCVLLEEQNLHNSHLYKCEHNVPSCSYSIIIIILLYQHNQLLVFLFISINIKYHRNINNRLIYGILSATFNKWNYCYLWILLT